MKDSKTIIDLENAKPVSFGKVLTVVISWILLLALTFYGAISLIPAPNYDRFDSWFTMRNQVYALVGLMTVIFIFWMVRIVKKLKE